MKEPFSIVDRSDTFEIPSFSPSSLNGEFWQLYKKLTDPRPISDELNEIFDRGNEVHVEDEILSAGAKAIVSSEDYIRIMHDSKEFCVSGFHDYIKFDFRGLYVEDLKSTAPGGFYYFLKEKINRGYLIQLSIYAYLYYVKTGVWVNRGVITKIDKTNPRNRISLQSETDLMAPSKVRSFILTHPVINFFRGKIDEEELITLAIQNLSNVDPKNPASPWVCRNCQYRVDCEIMKRVNEKK